MPDPAPRSTLDRLLASLPAEDGLDFVQLLEALYAVRYCGPVTFDFLNGRARQINLGQPVRLSIVQGGLDNGGGTRRG